MHKNIGTSDRLIRLAIAILLLIDAWWIGSWIMLAFGLFVLFEAIVGWCAFYQLIGKNTCSTDQEKD